MADLTEQAFLEDHTLKMSQEEKDAGPLPEGKSVTLEETFQHYACLYIKYLQIFKKLEEAYDNMGT